MPDTAKLRRKILLRVLASPLTVMPFLGGATVLVVAWASGMFLELGLVAGLAGMLGSAGVFLSRLVLGGEAQAKKALEEMQEEARAAREHALDDLEARLVADGDPRTEAALRDLRSLTRAFEELRNTEALGLNALSVLDILSGAAQLFEQCVRSLEQTLKFWHTAHKMVTKAAREPILRQREEILRDVARSIRHLGEVLVAVQNLESGDGAQSALTRIREDLDQHLAVARQVERRVKEFEDQLESNVHE